MISVIDVVGLYLVFRGKNLLAMAGDLDIKILSVALGWAAADLASTHLVDIIFVQGWSNAMKMEYIYTAAKANFELLEIVGLAYLAYSLTRKEESQLKRALAFNLILLHYLIPVVILLYKESTHNL